MQERKNIHKEKVIYTALEFFTEFGIENSKVNDIAIKAGVTERTVFRYFKTKNDLVLAAALLFWNNRVSEINELMKDDEIKNLSGIEMVKFILKQYTKLYDFAKKELIFCDEAETYLNRSEKLILLKNRPPKDFNKSNDPLAKAIRAGLKDKTIKNKDNIDLIYLNTYDSLLGFMQKLALTQDLSNDENIKKRLDLFIDSIIKMYI